MAVGDIHTRTATCDELTIELRLRELAGYATGKGSTPAQRRRLALIGVRTRGSGRWRIRSADGDLDTGWQATRSRIWVRHTIATDRSTLLTAKGRVHIACRGGSPAWRRAANRTDETDRPLSIRSKAERDAEGVSRGN